VLFVLADLKHVNKDCVMRSRPSDEDEMSELASELCYYYELYHVLIVVYCNQLYGIPLHCYVKVLPYKSTELGNLYYLRVDWSSGISYSWMSLVIVLYESIGTKVVQETAFFAKAIKLFTVLYFGLVRWNCTTSKCPSSIV